MPGLLHQRCFNHARREAAARCPKCGQFYCRECVAEHEGRVLCATCLRRLAERPAGRRRALVGVGRLAQLVFGVFTAWLFFYLVGAGLLSIPASFHEGTVWKDPWWGER
jgi:hypothetical protein